MLTAHYLFRKNADLQALLEKEREKLRKAQESGEIKTTSACCTLF